MGGFFRAYGPGRRCLDWKIDWGTNNVSVAETSDGRHLMIGQGDGLMVLRSLPDGQELRRFTVSTGAVVVLTVPQDARPFCYSDGRYCRWNSGGTEMETSWKADVLLTCRDVLPDGSGFVTARYDGTYWHQLLERATPNVGHLDQREIMGLAVSPNMTLLATASDFGQVCLWAMPSNRPVATLGGFLGAVRGLGFSPDGTRLATGAGGADSLCLWELEGYHRLIRIPTDSSFLHPLKFSPDGNTIVGQDASSGRLRVWTAPTWDEIAARNGAPLKAP